MKDYFEILNIDLLSNDTEIKAAYRRLALKYHPDRNNNSNESKEKFIEIQEAYDTLIDGERKRKYMELFYAQGLHNKYMKRYMNYGKDASQIKRSENKFERFLSSLGFGGICVILTIISLIIALCIGALDKAVTNVSSIENDSALYDNLNFKVINKTDYSKGNIYAIGKELYNIPDDKLQEFLTDFPQAVKLTPAEIKVQEEYQNLLYEKYSRENIQKLEEYLLSKKYMKEEDMSLRYTLYHYNSEIEKIYDFLIKNKVKGIGNNLEEFSERIGFYMGEYGRESIYANDIENREYASYNNKKDYNYLPDMTHYVYPNNYVVNDRRDTDRKTKGYNEQPKWERPETGDSPYNLLYGNGKYDKTYDNFIKVINGSSNDAVVVLYNIFTKRVVRNVYVRSRDSYKMKYIPEGTYGMKVAYGNYWNPTKGKYGGFEKNRSYSDTGYESSFDMYVENDFSGYSIPTYTVTLHKVTNGNMKTKSISEEEFFSN